MKKCAECGCPLVEYNLKDGLFPYKYSVITFKEDFIINICPNQGITAMTKKQKNEFEKKAKVVGGRDFRHWSGGANKNENLVFCSPDKAQTDLCKTKCINDLQKEKKAKP